MKMILVLAITLAGVSAASAQYYGRSSGSYGAYGTGSNSSNHYVDGYTRNNGTYVAPHYQTNSNGTQYDNYSTRGNYNPYTGSYGTQRPRY